MGDFANNKILPPGSFQGSNIICYTKFKLSDVKITPYIGQIIFFKNTMENLFFTFFWGDLNAQKNV